MHARLSLEKGTAYPSNYSMRLDERVSLGRSSVNTIVVRDKWVSKQHAQIFAARGRWYIRDLRSHNGVKVNGRRVQIEAELPPSSEVVLGEVSFRFTVEGGMEGGDHPPALDPSENATPNADAHSDDETVLHPDELTALYTLPFRLSRSSRGRTASSASLWKPCSGKRGPTWSASAASTPTIC